MCDNFRPFAFTVDGTVVTGKLRFIRLRERLFSSPGRYAYRFYFDEKVASITKHSDYKNIRREVLRQMMDLVTPMERTALR